MKTFNQLKKIEMLNKDTGNKELVMIEKGGMITDTIMRLKNGTTATFDENEIRREVFNHSYDEKITFISDNPRNLGHTVECGARNFCILPHAYYRGITASGRDAKVTLNFGDQIGVGNTKPSRPEVKKIIG